MRRGQRRARAAGGHGSHSRGAEALVLVAVALAGCAAAGFAVVLALTSDHVREPEVQAALVVWVILAYVMAGAIAWWRRPESHLGLLIAAGFGTFISMLGWSNNDLLHRSGRRSTFCRPSSSCTSFSHIRAAD